MWNNDNVGLGYYSFFIFLSIMKLPKYALETVHSKRLQCTMYLYVLRLVLLPYKDILELYFTVYRCLFIDVFRLYYLLMFEMIHCTYDDNIFFLETQKMF